MVANRTKRLSPTLKGPQVDIVIHNYFSSISAKPALLAFCTLVTAPAAGISAPLLSADLASFSVLGGSTVTNVPTSAIVGNVGVWSDGGANAVTGFNSAPGVAVLDPQVTSGLVHAGTALAEMAQGDLSVARTHLGSLGVGTLLGSDLAGLTLSPGVYTVPAGTTNLSGQLILDGGGSAKSAWVFQMPSTLITSPDSIVSIINSSANAGVFWNVGSSATVDVNTTFLGNILAQTSITVNTAATNLCGRYLTEVAAVTLQQTDITGTCTGFLSGSEGLSGGLRVTNSGSVVLASVTAVPVSGAMFLYGSALTGLLLLGKRATRTA